MGLLNYWPVLFIIAFLVMIVSMAIGHVTYKKNLQQESYMDSINNMNRLMNNNPHVTDERKLVDTLSKCNITYSGVE